MWLCGRDPQRQCQTVDREDWGSGLYQLSFKNFDNFVCLFRGGKLKDPTHPEKKTCHGLTGVRDYTSCHLKILTILFVCSGEEN